MSANTLLLRLEGPLQSWGDQESKFVIRRTSPAPTKSGVIGLICAAMRISRADARRRLGELNTLQMGVRIDRPGIRWWDYHTVGAGMQMRIAEGEGKSKPGAMLTRREYLCDASFLVVLQGDSELVSRMHQAVSHPVWPLYLGRKNCPASLPLLGRTDEVDLAECHDLSAAMSLVPWRPRMRGDHAPASVECLLEWCSAVPGDCAPVDAEVWYDVAQSFDVPGHTPRFVIRKTIELGDKASQVPISKTPRQSVTPLPLRARADYTNSAYQEVRSQRLEKDEHLCTFCKCPATTVQHVTYRHAGGGERIDELRSLCRLCHDAVTMIEYGQGMGLDRINPEDPQWRQEIIDKREEIVQFRSLETRRRRLRREEVE
jgi:CRISPR system Cascade subunit CasD